MLRTIPFPAQKWEKTTFPRAFGAAMWVVVPWPAVKHDFSAGFLAAFSGSSGSKSPAAGIEHFGKRAPKRVLRKVLTSVRIDTPDRCARSGACRCLPQVIIRAHSSAPRVEAQGLGAWLVRR